MPLPNVMKPQAVFLAGGVGLILACLAMTRVENLVEAPRVFLLLFGAAFVCYGAALWATPRLGGRHAFLFVLVVAGLARLVFLWTPPTLSTDAYRYVWDARVARAGISPYAAPPTDTEVAHLREGDIFPRLNHPTWRTIYPPGAQLFFRLVYAVKPDSVIAMKVALGIAELVTLAVLVSLLRALGLPLVQLAVYAWNPLVLLEVWGSGHLDALVVLSVVAAVRLAIADRKMLAAVVLGLGTLVKLYPAALLALLLRGGGRRPWAAFALVVVLGYAPLVALGSGAFGSLSQYVTTEFFNPGLLRTIIDVPALAMIALPGWVVGASLLGVAMPLIHRIVVLIGGFILLSPNIFPWYVLWLVPFLAIRPSAAWIAFTGTVVLGYTYFLHQPWAIPTWARVAEFTPLAVGAAFAVGRSLLPRRAAPDAALASPLGQGGRQ
jgi:alpha-1,6-mannosyltransferase